MNEELGPTRGSVCKRKILCKLLAFEVRDGLELQVPPTFALPFKKANVVFYFSSASEFNGYVFLVSEDATELYS